MAEAMRGLKVKPTYESMIGVAFSYGLEIIRFPNRDAKSLRDGFILSQLDGECMRQMQLQQEQASKQAFKESLLKQIVINTGSNLSGVRNQKEADLRTERVNQALNPNTCFLISHEVTMICTLFIACHRAMMSRWETIYHETKYHARYHLLPVPVFQQ